MAHIRGRSGHGAGIYSTVDYSCSDGNHHVQHGSTQIWCSGEEIPKDSTDNKSTPAQDQSAQGDIGCLTARYKAASVEEKRALGELRNDLHEQISSLRRAETNRKNRKERSNKRASFSSNPFQFMKKLRGDKRSGRLDCPRHEVEDHLRKVHSDENRDQDLGDPDTLMSPRPPRSAVFDNAEPRLQQVKDIIRKARSGSAPDQEIQEIGQGGVEEGTVTRLLVVLYRMLHTKGGIFQDSETVPNYFFAECGGKGVFVCSGKVAHYIHAGKQVHGQLTAEGGNTRGLRMPRIHQCAYTAYKGGQGNQRRSDSLVAVSSPQACRLYHVF